MTTNDDSRRGGRSEKESVSTISIGIVGPCGAGKTTLAEGLKQHGYTARVIAQEHSYVKDMWRRLTNPDVLIFLQASHTVGGTRRKLNWTEADWQEQQRRLSHAREHADFFLDTNDLGIREVLERVLDFLDQSRTA